MIVIGLTGSIGMGKSTVAAMLEELGVPVHDSDKTVHELMMPGEAGYNAIVAAFPYFEYPKLYKDKVIDRAALGALVFSDDEKREILESILHPLVRESQQKFIRDQKRIGREMAALDIPLLFETGAEARIDFTIVASAPFHVQKERVLARPGMTEEKFESILSRQIPDAEKCARADFVVHTGLGRAQSMKELKLILNEIKKRA